MRIRILAGIAGAALALAACGSAAPELVDEQAGAADLAPAAPVAPAQVATPEPAPAAIATKSGSTAIGEVLTDSAGLTLYGFTNDVDAVSTCYGTCADAWPPIIVPVDFTVGPGLDFGIFATTVRDDGQLQLVAGKWPLYTFAGDAAPGDLTGQGSGDVWFAANVDGTLITGDAPQTEEAVVGAPVVEEAESAVEPTVATTMTTSLGDALVDEDGLTLYGFTNDVDGVPTCSDACADAWPALLVDGPDLPAGLDPDVFSVVNRTDGSFQLRAGVWPLYRFAGDAIPGDVNGQGSGDVWWAAAPDGSLIRGGGEVAAEPPMGDMSEGDMTDGGMYSDDMTEGEMSDSDMTAGDMSDGDAGY